jgi:hypothetical protein
MGSHPQSTEFAEGLLQWIRSIYQTRFLTAILADFLA